MPPLARGSRLRDNDPRHGGRIVVLTWVAQDQVGYRIGKRDYALKRNRIFDDGKERHQGYSVVVGLDQQAA